MASIALFPCCFTNGAAVVGELSAILRLSVYTDEMLLADLASRISVPAAVLKSRLFGKTYPNSLEVVERERLLNQAATQLALELVQSGGKLYYGFHVALLAGNPRWLLRVQILGSLSGRVQRAMRLEGIGAEKAARLIAVHDRRAAILYRLVHGTEPYLPQFSELRLDCDRLAHSVIIETICKRFQLLVDQPPARRKVKVVKCVGTDLVEPPPWDQGKPGPAGSSPARGVVQGRGPVGSLGTNIFNERSWPNYLESVFA